MKINEHVSQMFPHIHKYNVAAFSLDITNAIELIKKNSELLRADVAQIIIDTDTLDVPVITTMLGEVNTQEFIKYTLSKLHDSLYTIEAIPDDYVEPHHYAPKSEQISGGGYINLTNNNK